MTSPIVRLHKQLAVPPTVLPVGTFRIRSLQFATNDIHDWLRIHNATIAERGRGRDWDAADFSREFASFITELKTNLTPTCQIWFAEPTPNASKPQEPVGTISLRMEKPQLSDQPKTATINWLAIDPRFRRRGVATCLVRTAEFACWQWGVRRIELTTHRDWKPAIALYSKLGFT